MLQMDTYVQLEIRAYANIIGQELVSKCVPWHGGFYRLQIERSQFLEIRNRVLNYNYLMTGDLTTAKEYLISQKLLTVHRLKRRRELIEMEVKLRMAVIDVDWGSI